MTNQKVQPLPKQPGLNGRAARQQINPSIHKAVERWNNNLSDMRLDYESASETRFLERPSGMFLQGSGADYSFRDEMAYFYLLGVARHIEENDPNGNALLAEVVNYSLAPFH